MTVRVCLNMIVKNESRIMSRCLGALMGLVDYICVCDTGSTDDTVEIIHAFCKEKIENGQLTGYRVFHHPWKNFGVNRTWAVHECQRWLMESYAGTIPGNEDNKNPDEHPDPQDQEGPEGFMIGEADDESSPPGEFQVPRILSKSALHVLEETVILFLDADMRFWVHPGMTETAFRALKDTEKQSIHDRCLHDSNLMTLWKNSLKNYPLTLVYQYGNHIIYPNIRFIRGDTWIMCHGPTHEFYAGTDITTGMGIEKKVIIHDCSIEDVGDGGAKSDKFTRDIRLLQDALREDPKNTRYWFYLANSYKNSGAIEDAIKAYKKRIDLKGWVEEIFMSHLYMGECYELLEDRASAMLTYLQGYHALPVRSETLYRACVLSRKMGLYHVSQMMALQGKKIPIPSYPALFLETQVYTYLFDEEISIYSYYIHDYETGRKACEKIINDPHIDPDRKELAKSNLRFYVQS